MLTKLIIGQGNPDSQYLLTRHNLGFLALDFFQQKHGLEDFKLKSKFHAQICQFTDQDTKVILAKPTTFYNETGKSARAICDFFNINYEDVLVVHDELSLDFGVIRTRLGGSDAGNKGIKSLNSHLGTDYYRLRAGVANDLTSQIPAPDFVLSKFTKSESEHLAKILLPLSGNLMDNFIKEKLELTSYSTLG